MSQDLPHRAPGRPAMTNQHLPVDFSAFHHMHRPVYLRWAQTVLNHRADAEEAVDAAFEQLLMIWTVVLSKENPAAYAWSVLRSRTLDLARARSRRPALLEEAAFETVALARAADPIGQLEESLALFHAVRQLPPRQMDVMLLLHLHGLSPAQVGDHLGITAAAVRSTARHAKRRLRHTLGLADRSTEEGHADDIAH
ncbi:sigma-70 family RNA polymerase sigma factor [Streptomyces sp. NPDC051597]|uniref:sigma-70 family RNA polymerase sigma factor n=1 Tax=Streptomyces sp. NPDC051597 TaxID=3155049 RepID=UPI0034438824